MRLKMNQFMFGRRRTLGQATVLAAGWSVAFGVSARVDSIGAQELPPRPVAIRITPETLKAMAQRIEAHRVENEIPSIAVAVVHKGEIVFEKGFGFARLEEQTPATPHTQYAIGSVSKALTAAGLMRLVEQGVVDLDRPVNDYLGDTPLRSAVGDPNDITVRQVATHTAGLETYWHMVNDEDPLGVPSRADQIAQYGVAMIPPGQQHLYSNLGYAVLARVIELQSGIPFDKFMQGEILEPLSMTRTTMGPDPLSDAAPKYSGDDGRTGIPVPAEPGLPLPNFTALALASGHYYSTADDLARFALFNLKHAFEGGHAPLSHAALDEMHRPTVYQAKYIGQAIAWETVEDGSGVFAVEHAGGGPGMRARLELFPQDDLATVLLVNDTRLYPFIGIKRIILEELNPGFYGYRASLFDFPLESNATDEAAEKLSEEEKRALWLETAKALGGQWDAQIGGPLGNHPITLTIKETGDVFVDFDRSGLPSVLTRTELSPTGIAGLSLGHVNPEHPWRNAPHYVRLSLKIADGKIKGRVEFRSYAVAHEASPYSYFSMSHWVEFKRRSEEPPSR